jgi:hypothetical protein
VLFQLGQRYRQAGSSAHQFSTRFASSLPRQRRGRLANPEPRRRGLAAGVSHASRRVYWEHASRIRHRSARPEARGAGGGPPLCLVHRQHTQAS